VKKEVPGMLPFSSAPMFALRSAVGVFNRKLEVVDVDVDAEDEGEGGGGDLPPLLREKRRKKRLRNPSLKSTQSRKREEIFSSQKQSKE